MTDQSSPITPPPELVEQWYDAIDNQSTSWKQQLATRAAQWGADQELEACCKWLDRNCGRWELPVLLRNARRPKPPSLKEQGLAAAARFYAKGHEDCTEQEVRNDYDALCRALGALPND